jgi:hypothetical protein
MAMGGCRDLGTRTITGSTKTREATRAAAPTQIAFKGTLRSLLTRSTATLIGGGVFADHSRGAGRLASRRRELGEERRERLPHSSRGPWDSIEMPNPILVEMNESSEIQAARLIRQLVYFRQ